MKTKNNNGRRPMTKIEQEAMDTMMTEFKDKLPSNEHSHYKVNGSDLQRTILYAIAGITMHRKDVKQTYQMWMDDTSDPEDWWALSVTLVSFKKVWKRAEELLRPRLEEIDGAQWYMVTYKDGQESKRNYFNGETADDVRRECRYIRMWDLKVSGLYRATWDGKSFTTGQRIPMKNGLPYILA